MSPHDPRRGGGEAWKRGSSVSGLDFGRFWAKIVCNFFFIKKGQMTTFLTPLDALIPKKSFSFVLVFGPHVGPMPSVCPRNSLTKEPPPPPGGGA